MTVHRGQVTARRPNANKIVTVPAKFIFAGTFYCMMKVFIVSVVVLTLLNATALKELYTGRTTDVSESEGSTLSLAGVLQLARLKRTIFVDARTPKAFAAGRLEGAISMPTHEEPADQEVLSQLRSAGAVIIYCDSASCHQAARLREKLKASGLLGCYVYSGGFSEWAASGLPVEKTKE